LVVVIVKAFDSQYSQYSSQSFQEPETEEESLDVNRWGPQEEERDGVSGRCLQSFFNTFFVTVPENGNTKFSVLVESELERVA